MTGGDSLYESNLDDILSLVNEARNSFPEKSIWLYTGFALELLMAKIYQPTFPNDNFEQYIKNHKKRQEIISLCNVVVDSEYIDKQRDITLKWRGSDNQRVIDVKQSFAQNDIVLYCG